MVLISKTYFLCQIWACQWAPLIGEWLSCFVSFPYTCLYFQRASSIVSPHTMTATCVRRLWYHCSRNLLSLNLSQYWGVWVYSWIAFQVYTHTQKSIYQNMEGLQNNVRTQLDQSESDSPCRILLRRGLGSFWGVCMCVTGLQRFGI